MTINNQLREEIWSQFDQNWDLIIIGGGITGAGIFRMAAEHGYKTLLVEAGDFSIGTSSRSSKLVHGGLRYIRNLQLKVTYESVKERERLLREAPNLVTPLRFIFPIYKSYHVTTRQIGFSLGLYDLFANKKAHGQISEQELNSTAPLLLNDDLAFSYHYGDALVDDSRLVLRNIQEGRKFGGVAINYIKVHSFLFNKEGAVSGVGVEDFSQDAGKTREIHARIVVNATGPWADDLRRKVTQKKIIRKQRGSHIQFSRERFPIDCASSIIHPADKRFLFVIPWEGVTIVGTTDLNHPSEMENESTEPYMTNAEEEYLLEAANHFFPSLELASRDIISSFAGLRPIVSTDASNPSKASRAHVILDEQGLITIAGGKLTTYRQMAYEVMQKVMHKIHSSLPIQKAKRLLNGNNEMNSTGYPLTQIQRWAGRFGDDLPMFIESIKTKESELIPENTACWSEIRWAARHENIIHLDDLLLRRVRLGLTLPDGGKEHFGNLQRIIQEELDWGQNRWQQELNRYQEIIKKYYSRSKNGLNQEKNK
jgi:glycerol-3-phosphate dehydrogenase